MKFRQNEEWSAYLFILPAFLLLVLFTFYPMSKALYTSFFDYELLKTNSQFIGFDNYKAILTDQEFWLSLYRSFYFAVVVIPVQTLIALGMALLVYKKTKLTSFFRTIYYLPVIMAIAVASTVFKLIYNQQYGILNTFLKALGLPITNFLSDPDTAMIGVIILGIWKAMGFFMLVFIAGLNNIPEVLYEAAEVDGTGRMQKFFYITLPLLKRTMAFVVIITTMDAIKISGPIFVLTNGGPAGSTSTIVYFIVKMAFEQMKLGYAAAAAFLLFIIVLIISLIQFRMFRSNVEY